MKPLYVLFKVSVSSAEYSYHGQRGEAEMRIQVPRGMLEGLDPSTLFVGILKAALVNYDRWTEEEQE